MYRITVAALLVSVAAALFAQELPETAAGWQKYAKNPVLGNKDTGTCFDITVLQEAGHYKMWFSWRPKKSIGYTESKDGINWSQPVIVLSPANNDWEKNLNRPGVVKKDGIYHLWYTAQRPGGKEGSSTIGYATSSDGIKFERKSDKPVLEPGEGWERKTAVMCPHVEWDADEQIFKMWYSGGGNYEPDAVGYATSKDGLVWKKYAGNPVFFPDKSKTWEQHKVTGAQIVKHRGWYIAFYIGFENEHLARIGIARSKDGITNWQRMPLNPIISPGKDWDASACYKPFAVYDEADKKWRLWYNGRHNAPEYIGLATHEGEYLGF
ncbi:MAG: hypothetical protein LBT46_09005 [Planctomycetaceae bacterium]|jgi:predicted GH43/DUF377 family glycosyl hydrolase|nr:hypothetical protein [Planctomycetaceae bacterium]